jgi:hypothetical protein
MYIDLAAVWSFLMHAALVILAIIFLGTLVGGVLYLISEAIAIPFRVAKKHLNPDK